MTGLGLLAPVRSLPGDWLRLSLSLAGLPWVLGLVGWPLLGSDFDSVTSRLVDELLSMKRDELCSCKGLVEGDSLGWSWLVLGAAILGPLS